MSHYTITASDANVAISLIAEYLCEGGAGLDDEALVRVLQALCCAKTITINSDTPEVTP
jgi:hypothetical protein